jgi:hypothetical protein
VPESGKFIALRRIETTAWKGVEEEVTHTIHPDNVSAAITASKIFQLEVAGVGTDISLPWHLERLVKGNGRIPVGRCFLPEPRRWRQPRTVRLRFRRKACVCGWQVLLLVVHHDELLRTGANGPGGCDAFG